MAEQVDIDFYQEKDEAAFLEAWEAAYGPISNEEIDELYKKIALDIHEKVQNETIKLGDSYRYKEVLVGYCDYNSFNQLYLFSQTKK
ncbi:hypothetical protein JHE06_09935 [Carnobacterium sp. CS13]|uniref:hypothetical protein n=1 Tax=Carnobacterium sp. CS13 TaxID=2800128 RepID=UPI001914AC14|nr:hypothetical protein JHE06_09935 [Carnobacterium sp. CS13]